MLILGHTPDECRKALAAAITFLAAALALFLVYDPGIKDAVIVLSGSAVSIVAVFVAPKFDIEDLSKALAQLITQLQTLLAFFVVINPSVWVVIGSLVAFLPAAYYVVWRVPNAEPINMTVPPAPPPRPAPGPPDPPRPPLHRPVS